MEVYLLMAEQHRADDDKVAKLRAQIMLRSRSWFKKKTKKLIDETKFSNAPALIR
jgi:hypothetical protein